MLIIMLSQVVDLHLKLLFTVSCGYCQVYIYFGVGNFQLSLRKIKVIRLRAPVHLLATLNSCFGG